MSQLKVYPEYKDSEVQWIGGIPNHWNIIKLKHLASIVTGNTPPKSNKDNYIKGIYPWVKPDNFNINYTISDTKEKLSEKGIKVARVIPEDSALVCSIGTVGKVAINSEPVTTNQQINSIVFDKNDWISDYGIYAIISAEEEFKRYANKVVISILNKTSQENVFMPLPSISEQISIGKFIKIKTTEIDNLISDKERLIELLEEKRQAVITETVTKGLDPDVKMKDSGIEWIGAIPEHWVLGKVGYIYEITLGKMIQPLLKDKSDKLVPYLKANNIQDGYISYDKVDKMYANQNDLIKYILKPNDLLVCEGGDVARSAFVEKELNSYIFQNALHRVRGSTKGRVRYLHYLLRTIRSTGYIDILVNRATIAHFTRDKFSSLKIPIPPEKEQKKIEIFIQNIEIEINKTIKEIAIQINKLKEYRESLIYEAVTGKIDVRDYSVEKEEVY